MINPLVVKKLANDYTEATIIGQGAIKGDKGDPGPIGPNGPEGKSAYEVAVEAGFVGTEEEWLESLHGDDGNNGKSAYEIAVEEGFVGTEEEWLASLKGEKGDPGTLENASLEDLDDVNISELKDGHILTYNEEKKEWNNSEINVERSDEIDLKDSDILATSMAVSKLNDKIHDIELFKFPNATIIGNPTINDGQVSDFTANDYLNFPFLVDFKNRPFVINMCFTTGSDVNSQHNIMDSKFGLAIAVQNSHFIAAISTNGSSWDLGANSGTYTVLPNTTYYVSFAWDGSKYELSYSLDKESYIIDISIPGTKSPYPKQVYIGIGDVGGTNPHPFNGIINLNYCNLYISGNLAWQGMDDAGLATRLAVDMSNIDPDGVAKIKEIAGENNYLVNGFNNSRVDLLGNHNVRVAAADSGAPVQAYVDLYLSETEPDVFKSTASIDADELFVTNYTQTNFTSPKINLGTANTTTTTAKGQFDVRGNQTIHNGDFVMEHKNGDDTTSLELSISEDTALVEGVNAELELKSNTIRLNGTTVADGSLYVDQITTNKDNKVLINENTKINGDLELTGDLRMGDSGMKAMYFETKGGDVTIKDDDGSVIHELSKKMDSTDLLSTDYVFESDKPNQLTVNGAFVAKNSDDFVGKMYKKRDSWLKMTRNGIRMGIISHVKNWEEIRRNFIEIGNHTLRIFSTKRVEINSDQHIRIGAHIGTNTGYSPWRPYDAQLDVDGDKNRVDLSNANAKFSVDADGIEAKTKNHNGYSWSKFRIGGFPRPYTWSEWKKRNPLGIPTEQNDWKQRVPFTQFHVDTSDDVLISRHNLVRNTVDGVAYVDWNRDTYLHLGGYEAKLMYAKQLDANGYSNEIAPHYGIKCGPHSGVQVYGYLMAGGLNPSNIVPVTVRGGLKVFPGYYTGNGKACWEFKADGIYFNGVKKVSV